MNPGLVVKLRPAGPWRIGPDSGARNRVDAIYHSDSLYSAVTSAMSRMGSLSAWLDATARSRTPAVCFSSCFPFLEDIGFVVPPRTLWPPTSPALIAARVRWKSARFIPLSVVESILAGQRLNENQWSVDGASACLVPAGKAGPFRTSVRWNAAVDRLSGASERHATACIEFREGCGLWTVAGFRDDQARDEWQEPVKAAFRLLADTGFGGERSRGWGRAETPEFVEGTLPGLIIEYRRKEPSPAPPIEEPPSEEPPVTEPPPEEEPGPAPVPAVEAEAPAESSPAEEAAAVPAAETPPIEEPPSEEPPVTEPPPEEEPGPAPVPAVEGIAAPETTPPPIGAATVRERLPAASEMAEMEPDEAVGVEPEMAGAAPDEAVGVEPDAAGAAPDEAVGVELDVAGAAPDEAVGVELDVAGAAPETVGDDHLPADAEPQVEPPPEAGTSAEEASPSFARIDRLKPAPPAAAVRARDLTEPMRLAAEREAAPTVPVPAAPLQAHWLLSLFTPAAADAVDWGRGNYSVLARGGRIDSPSGSGELKKQIQMVAEGSVLYADGVPLGAAADVAPDGFAHPVFRAGFALAIPLPEVH
jgi:CRISPR type III-A-associated RAMP protein Csm4